MKQIKETSLVFNKNYFLSQNIFLSERNEEILVTKTIFEQFHGVCLVKGKLLWVEFLSIDEVILLLIFNIKSFTAFAFSFILFLFFS